jgi:hypothetical protein
MFYKEADGQVPVLEWLRALQRRDRRAAVACIARSNAWPPWGTKLRARRGRVQYRILYFFHGQRLAVLAHALTKEGQVPPTDLERAIRRKAAFAQDPEKHSYAQELRDGEDDRRPQNPRSDDRR